MSYTPKGYINIGGNVYPKETRTRRKSAPDLLSLLREAREALKALLVMMDRGDKPRKLDETLTWVQNDLKARTMATAAIARLDEALREYERHSIERGYEDVGYVHLEWT